MAKIKQLEVKEEFKPVELLIETRAEFDTLIVLLGAHSDSEVLHLLQERLSSPYYKLETTTKEAFGSASWMLYITLKKYAMENL